MSGPFRLVLESLEADLADMGSDLIVRSLVCIEFRYANECSIAIGMAAFVSEIAIMDLGVDSQIGSSGIRLVATCKSAIESFSIWIVNPFVFLLIRSIVEGSSTTCNRTGVDLLLYWF